MERPPSWHVITGEYPPQSGGVGDYTERLAGALVAAGCDVHVWCPAVSVSSSGRLSRSSRLPSEAVDVRRLEHGYGVPGLQALDRALSGYPAPRIVLVQYVPNAFGAHGANIAFCLWLLRRSRVDDVRVMFHEPYFYFGWQRPARNLLAALHRIMAVLLLASSHRVYMASETWTRYLRPYLWAGARPLVPLNVPATIPRIDAPSEVARLRRRLTPRDGSMLVGHFGTYGDHVRPILMPLVSRLLAQQPSITMLCLGSNSDRFVEDLITAQPQYRGRLLGGGFMSSEELSLHMQACDLFVQPYPDGVTGRRTSAMAILANGVAMLTNAGPLTEPFWHRSDGVALAATPHPDDLVRPAQALLRDERRRRMLAEAGRRVYAERFSWEHVTRVLLADADQADHG